MADTPMADTPIVVWEWRYEQDSSGHCWQALGPDESRRAEKAFLQGLRQVSIQDPDDDDLTHDYNLNDMHVQSYMGSRSYAEAVIRRITIPHLSWESRQSIIKWEYEKWENGWLPFLEVVTPMVEQAYLSGEHEITHGMDDGVAMHFDSRTMMAHLVDNYVPTRAHAIRRIEILKVSPCYC